MSDLSPESVKLETGSPAGQTDKTTGQSEVSDDKLKDNPYIANPQGTGGPVLVRRHDNWIPKPWKKIEHIIIASYVCYLFLFFPGAFANKNAFEAMKYRDLGALSMANKLAKIAVMWIYIGFGIGACCAVILCIVLPLTI